MRFLSESHFSKLSLQLTIERNLIFVKRVCFFIFRAYRLVWYELLWMWKPEMFCILLKSNRWQWNTDKVCDSSILTWMLSEPSCLSVANQKFLLSCRLSLESYYTLKILWGLGKERTPNVTISMRMLWLCGMKDLLEVT